MTEVLLENEVDELEDEDMQARVSAPPSQVESARTHPVSGGHPVDCSAENLAQSVPSQ